MDLGPLREALSRLDALIWTLDEKGCRLRSVSVGGGLAVAYRPSDTPPSLGDYAALITTMAERWKTKLILEPGRWLVADAGRLLTRVIRLKTNASRTFVVVDAGMNDLPRPSIYNSWHEIRPIRPRTGAGHKVYNIVGPLCETSDVFGSNRAMPVLQPGDLLAIEQAGAYCSSMAGNYNSRLLPAEVVIVEGKWFLARRRQHLDELLRLEL